MIVRVSIGSVIERVSICSSVIVCVYLVSPNPPSSSCRRAADDRRLVTLSLCIVMDGLAFVAFIPDFIFVFAPFPLSLSFGLAFVSTLSFSPPT